VAFAVALFVSAVSAVSAGGSSDRGRALKFALRSLSGILLFFATRSLAVRSRARSVILTAVLASALISALTALLEMLLPQTARLWSAFREGGFNTFGLPRASGVFAYPTIGAMYWEASLPLAVVASTVSRPRGAGRWRAYGPLLGGSLLSAAILASATRSSLVGGLVVVLGMFVVARRWPGSLARSALVVAGTLVVCVLFGALGPGSALRGQRLRFWHDDTWFAATYTPSRSVAEVAPGGVVTTPLDVRNTGTLAWIARGEHQTRLGYHLYREDAGREVLLEFDGSRTELPRDVGAGETVWVVGEAYAPLQPGSYRIAWDIVTEGAAWFSDHGSPTSDVALTVRGGAPPEASRPRAMRHEEVAPPPGRGALWRAAVTLFEGHPLLGIGPDAFRWRYEALLGLAPNGVPYADTRIHANSLYFETLADMGVMGVAALVALLVGLAHALAAHVRARDVPGLAAGMGAAAFFVHGLSDCFLEFTPSLCLFWLLLGLSLGPTGRGRGGTPP
jgi:O-antigen ligase